MDYVSCITECTEKKLKASKKLVGFILLFFPDSLILAQAGLELSM